MKFFHYNKTDKTRYWVEWRDGYVQFWHEWDQIHYKRFNWITFAIIEFEIERELGDGITINLGLLGLRLRLRWLWRESQIMKDMIKESKKIKKGLKEGKSYKELGLKEWKG